ncbi:tripartite tricarboxylate transporter TctB family protein [Halotalea alkalilenta]|uniref:DUF1468 domain-containing protein n=1 Tax=Halotalea alkalilenta TaxID=376489 RepID=A0A172YBG8_9GAMM|nr:tripartite tricarboxylate transporter TctB family protein [Halotalea alkalilenta]ANF56589.1 hypothetical protein A5892_03150 [Halotalea alkalilenta]
MNGSTGSIAFNALLLLGALAAFFAASGLPSGNAPETLPPAALPQAVAVLVGALAALCLVRELRAWRYRRAATKVAGRRSATAGVALMALMAAYAAAFETLGYLLSTMGFIVACVVMLGFASRARNDDEAIFSTRSLVTLAIIAIGVPVAVYCAFTWGFEVPLPTLR